MEVSKKLCEISHNAVFRVALYKKGPSSNFITVWFYVLKSCNRFLAVKYLVNACSMTEALVKAFSENCDNESWLTSLQLRVGCAMLPSILAAVARGTGEQ